MDFIQKFEICFRALFDEKARFKVMDKLHILDSLPDEEYIKRKYKFTIGKELNLESPKTFSEKLAWLNLYNRKEIYTTMVDKYLVKKYVANILGEEYVIPTIGVWDNPEEIDFSILPSQFVLKCNHNSGLGMCICRDKKDIDIKKVVSKLKDGIDENYYLHSREWPYKDVQRKIIAEKFIESEIEYDLTDYKFFCFNGFPRLCQVFKNRSQNESIDFFDMNWNHLDVKGVTKPYKPFFCGEIECPKNFEKMITMAEKLSCGVPFLRVDFYNIRGKIYFGELTFFPASGMGELYPLEWNKILGDMIILPTKN